MMLILSHDTAYEFWLSAFSTHKPDFGVFLQNHLTGVDSKIGDASQLSYMDTPMRWSQLYEHVGGIPTPLHALVATGANRVGSDLVTSHVWGEQYLPPNSIYIIGKNLGVVSPELCFIQMAQAHEKLNLAWLGTELCSCYTYDPYDKRNLIERQPITSSEKIEACIDALSGMRGARRARRALRFVHDRTRSPREATLAILLSAPSRMGGQQLPDFEVNAAVPLPGGSSLLTRRRFLEMDMYWRDAGLCIEYNGSPHESVEAAMSDMEKITTLSTMRIKVVPVNQKQFGDYRKLEVIVQALRKELGIRDRETAELARRRFVAHADLIRFERSWCDRPRLRDFAWWRIVESLASF